MTTVTRTRAELAEQRAALPGRVAVVMTMGALHDGHVELVRAARRLADSVLVTIFVNPRQFAAGEDLDRYPRPLDHDLAVCEREGVDLVFVPTVDEVYPADEPVVPVTAGPLGELLEGEHRPGHFDGVLTVVRRLLELTRPDVAVYGEKDAQQLALIRMHVAGSGLPVEVVGVPTVREADGLALSSRNVYLSPEERSSALALSRALGAAAGRAAEGPEAVLAAGREVLAAEPGVRADYLAVVDDETWQPARAGTGAARVLVAARVGTTRLIDNVGVILGTPSAG